MSSKDELLPGFDLEQLLGRGGMGEVYLAVQRSLGRRVAIKFMAGPLLDAWQHSAERFAREAQLMAESCHPHVVTVYDLGRLGTQPYLVMEYVEGRNLRAALSSGRLLPLNQVRAILQALGQALSHLHGLGILHRDLKPENVLLGSDGRIKVCDFGIAVPAAALGALTQSGEVLGTIDYLAPEQRYRLPVDARADQYAFGVLAYELLTGRLPLGRFAPLSAHQPGLPPAVDAAVLRALSDDPDDRFATVAEFALVLDQALAALPEADAQGAAARAITLPLAQHETEQPEQPTEVLDQPRARRGHRTRWLWPTLASVLTAVLASTWFGWPSQETADRAETAPRPPRADAPPLAAARFSPTQARAHQERWAQHLGVAVELVNNQGLQLRLIPPGTFLMGAEPADLAARLAKAKPHNRERIASEGPQRSVTLDRPFWLGRCEVTISQYRKFVLATGYSTQAHRLGVGMGRTAEGWVQGPHFNWEGQGTFPIQDEGPVANLTPADADAYCAWLTKTEGGTYRLPTEAEWEFACRAGSGGPWFFGADAALLRQYDWLADNSPGVPQPVGRKLPNPFGLYDLYGNVLELCADDRAPDSTSQGAAASYRVTRGESILGSSFFARSYSRHWHAQQTARYHTGFRVVRECN